MTLVRATLLQLILTIILGSLLLLSATDILLVIIVGRGGRLRRGLLVTKFRIMRVLPLDRRNAGSEGRFAGFIMIDDCGASCIEVEFIKLILPTPLGPPHQSAAKQKKEPKLLE